MKILVTGGAGFIGSHIVDAYINAGHSVAVIDNLSTGFKRNINKKARFYKADIKNLVAIEKIFKKERPEVVNHHAAMVEVIKSIRNPIPTFEVNVLGTANVLLAFGIYGKGTKKKFIFASTGGAIYGEPKKIPADESTPALPLSAYGLSKEMGETLIKFYARQHKFSYVILRYANVYGPRQNPKGEAGVVAIFGGLMKKGKTPVIFGDGAKSRDYVFVGDMVSASVKALGAGIKNETVNLGWGKIISDQMIYDTVAEHAGFDRAPIYAPYRKGEVYKVSLDAARARRLLKWKPLVPLSEGIKRTVKSL